ncbi:MAG: hypothetical protein K0B02_02995 [DPANN group archaeon]|nr:hypothetical protein [DPANN group archaeon]
MDKLSKILDEEGIEIVIGFSGGSDEKELEVKQVLEESFDILKNHTNIAILTGGTEWGIPNYATRMAKEHDIFTIGILPETGLKYKLSDDLLDYSIVVPSRMGESNYGDESELFAKNINGMIIIGGSSGTMIEASHTIKINERNIKYKMPLIYMAPVSGFAGFGDELASKPSYIKQDVLDECFPEYPIVDGTSAATFLLQKNGIL